MTKEFNLSDKITKGLIMDTQYEMIFKQDVKEFIKRLKEELTGNNKSFESNRVRALVDKLAGDKLK